MIRIPIVLLFAIIAVIVGCAGRAQRAVGEPELDPRRGRIQDLEESINVAHEQMSAGGAMCADVCRLADDICRAHDDICRLAGEDPADGWAHERCEQATVSCRDARARCLACR